MTRSAHVLASVAILAGLAPGAALAAEGRIVPGRSIGPIAVGDERASIAALGLGAGTVIARTPNPQAPGNRNLDAVTVAYPSRAIVVRFGTDEASALALVVGTRASRYRTAAGIGVGATRARVLAVNPRAVCGPALCRVGPFAGDRRVTRYHLAGALVSRVEVLRRAPGPP